MRPPLLSEGGGGREGNIWEKKVRYVFFIEKPCSVLPKIEYIYYSGTLLEHLNFTLEFKMVSFIF